MEATGEFGCIRWPSKQKSRNMMDERQVLSLGVGRRPRKAYEMDPFSRVRNSSTYYFVYEKPFLVLLCCHTHVLSDVDNL